MNKLIARTLVAAALAVTPIAAGAGEPSAFDGPIHLNAVQIQANTGILNNFAYPGLVTVSFTNTSSSAATDVVFTLRGYNGRIIGQYDDAGSYATGVSVRHTFTDLQPDANQQLEVEEATFADGTTWTKPAPFAPTALRQAR